MPEYVASKATEDELMDIHRDLHKAMDQIINRDDQAEAKLKILIVDQRMSKLINQLRIA